MREGIHPKYDGSTVSCICGETFETRSTTDNIRVEVCSKCHPFYTGQRQQKISSGGRIERFMKKYGQEAK